MLYALKYGSPHILMSDIDEESDVMRSSADSKSHPHTRCGILLSRGVLPTVEVSMMSMTPTRTGLTRHCQILKNKMEVNTGYGVVENSISRSLQRRRPHPMLVVSLVALPPEYPPRQQRERVPKNERKKIERERKSIEEEYRRDIIWGIGKGIASGGLHHRDGDLAPGLLQTSFRNEGQRTLDEYSHGRQSSQVVRGQQNLFVVWVPVLLQTQPLQGTLGCHVCTSEDGEEVQTIGTTR